MHRAAWFSLLACLALPGVRASAAPAVVAPIATHSPQVVTISFQAEGDPLLGQAPLPAPESGAEPGEDTGAAPPPAPPAIPALIHHFPPSGGARLLVSEENLPATLVFVACSIRGPPDWCR